MADIVNIEDAYSYLGPHAENAYGNEETDNYQRLHKDDNHKSIDFVEQQDDTYFLSPDDLRKTAGDNQYEQAVNT